MFMVMFLRDANCVFIDCNDCINMQIGAAVISDQHLPGASYSVVPDVVAGHSMGKSSPVNIHMDPRLSRIIPHKDGVRDTLIFRSVNAQVGRRTVAKELTSAKVDG